MEPTSPQRAARLHDVRPFIDSAIRLYREARPETERPPGTLQDGGQDAPSVAPDERREHALRARGGPRFGT